MLFHPRSVAALVAVSVNRGAGYEVVVLAHVLSAVIGFGAVGVAGAYALVLGRRGPNSESVTRYYRPGVNWAGRVLFVVPVLGFVLIGMSHRTPGGYGFSDGWVMVGLLLWAVAALAAEMVLWPTERGLQQLVAAGEWEDSAHRSLTRRMAWTSGALLVIFLASMVVMVAKP
ncbi:MAG TPA: DUF2269 family protein [Acidimicrobiales bacterium]|jgi:uncharacterized membrane protein|nr:DUF2269 family protein [Acidimicrobiales bacterium]